MSEKTRTMTLLSLCLVFIFSSCGHGDMLEVEISENIAKETVIFELPVATYEPVEISDASIPTITDEPEEEISMSVEDIELIALVTMAEAEGECEEGKRLVIDTILNRVDSVYFPNTVYDVIYQPSQFSSMWNGRVNRCEVREDICRLVIEELETRTNWDVMFFTAGSYSRYGVPMFQVENHYFSSYD